MRCPICTELLPLAEDGDNYREYYGYWYNGALVHVACASVTHLYTEMEDKQIGTHAHSGGPRFLGHSDICHPLDDREFWHKMLDEYLDQVKQDGSVKWTLWGMCGDTHQ